MRYFLKIVLLLAIILGNSGCWSPPVSLHIYAAKKLNCDTKQTSLPVVIAIYQLKERERFSSAQFYELWQHDKEFLGDTLLDKKIVTIFPATAEVFSFSKHRGLNYVGVAAFFRDPYSNSNWHEIVALPISSGVTPFSLMVELQNNNIKIYQS